MPRHRHQEWLKFLRRIDAETPKHLAVHLIADNYATHKHAKVQAWLKRHPRFHMHFTPASASWINQVERFFGLITGDRIRCGVFKSVAELVGAIQQYLEHHNADPKPFVWTASATAILDRVARGRQCVRVGTLVEMMAERGLSIAHTTIMRWVHHYIPEFERRWNRFAQPVGASWRLDETYVKVRGEWVYLYPAVGLACGHGGALTHLIHRISR